MFNSEPGFYFQREKMIGWLLLLAAKTTFTVERCHDCLNSLNVRLFLQMLSGDQFSNGDVDKSSFESN